VIVYAVVDATLSPDFPLGVELETFIRRQDAERFVEKVRGDDPELASNLRIEELEGRSSSTTEGRADAHEVTALVHECELTQAVVRVPRLHQPTPRRLIVLDSSSLHSAWRLSASETWM
jgi:hypothetical protein